MIEIRDATADDIEAMAELNARAWEFAFSSFMDPQFIAEKSDPVTRASRIQEMWEGEHAKLVAQNPEGQIIGFAIEYRPCTLIGYEAEIGALFVDPSASRTGAGRALVQEMVRRFLIRGAHSMAIHTLAQNKIGRSFYDKIGGQPGPTTTWYHLPGLWYIWPDLETLNDYFNSAGSSNRR